MDIDSPGRRAMVARLAATALAPGIVKARAQTSASSRKPGRGFQNEKAVVRAHHDAIAASTSETIAQALAMHTAPDWHWRGMHPFHERQGAASVADVFWKPYLNAMSRWQRRPDIFMAGLNEIDGFKSVWVVSMGHLMGLFDRPYLGIRPTQRIAMMRYAEFNRVDGNRITESALFCDIPEIMIQAGQNPFPPQTGAHLNQPGPLTHEGLMYTQQDPGKAEATLASINAMLETMDGVTRPPKEWAQWLAQTWNDDMIWWGPSSIGATYTIERYLRQHAGPFRAALGNGYKFNGHLAKIAEGSFGGFFGWPNLTVINSGGYLGMPASANSADMRVVDIYRVQDGKLSENWVFIDILHYLNMLGLDILARLSTL